MFNLLSKIHLSKTVIIILIILNSFIIIGCYSASKHSGDTDSKDTVTTCNGCLIDNLCYNEGQSNPLNSCEDCDTSISKYIWSNRINGSLCDDGLFCTVNDICKSGTCGGESRDCSDNIACTGTESCDEDKDVCVAGTVTCNDSTVCDYATDSCITTCSECLINNVCYNNNQINPLNVCQHCDTSLSSDTWSDHDGASCDDELFCNGSDTCSGGTCSVNEGDKCPDDGLFCTGEESCDENIDKCVTSGVPCNYGKKVCIENQNVSGVGSCICEAGWSGDNCDEKVSIIYVNGVDGNDSSNTGLSWKDAFSTIQTGLAKAKELVNGDMYNKCEVWVAKGTYVASKTPVKNATFQLVENVALYGGFSGNETALSERDFKNNLTILSGDLTNDDITDEEGNIIANNGNNSYHIVTGADMAIIDGFTITHGYGDQGGGMHNNHSSPTINNCIFSFNVASREGGGIYNHYSSPSINSCTFLGNTSSLRGGGLYERKSSSNITNCTFENNSSKEGGGIYSYTTNNKLTQIADCTFLNNTAVNTGGGISTYSKYSDYDVNNERHHSLNVINCKFINNSAEEGGGCCNTGDSSFYTNCIFEHNSSILSGGGMYNRSSSPVITNCTFYKNSAEKGGGAYEWSSSAVYMNSIFWNNSAQTGHSIYTSDSEAAVIYCIIEGGYAGTGNSGDDPLFTDVAGDNLTLKAQSPAIDAGNNDLLPEDTTDQDKDYDITEQIPFDLAGNKRIQNSIIDMGAYEH